MKTKYALVKTAAGKTVDGPECELLEVYTTEDPHTFDGYQEPTLNSIEDLEHALAQIRADGINTDFYENGWLRW